MGGGAACCNHSNAQKEIYDSDDVRWNNRLQNGGILPSGSTLSNNPNNISRSTAATAGAVRRDRGITLGVGGTQRTTSGGGAIGETINMNHNNTTHWIPDGDKKQLLSTGDCMNGMEKYQSSSSSTKNGVKAAVGITAAVTAGAVILGPVGLLLGVAGVGIGVGLTQIPEEQRNNLQNKAKNAMDKAHTKCRMANETLSTSCAVMSHNGCNGDSNGKKGGMMGEFKENDLFGGGGAGGAGDDGNQITLSQCGVDDLPRVEYNGASSVMQSPDRPSKHDFHVGEFHDDGGGGVGGDNISLFGENNVLEQVISRHPVIDVVVGGRMNQGNNRRIACLQKCRIAPVGQIHSIDPSRQPKAWFDVLASALTTNEEKNEAMEEILILARDKHHALMYLEEGILDALMCIISNFFRQHSAETSNNLPKNNNNLYHAQLAAKICISLGKAHCAAVHTEGDLHLMSSYNRGAVPVERQLAQLLHEVPHF
uniref:Uncharacterized protein n=1 Tax=Ditylum brightwellii TaxID=49249 RepID=A0A7S4SBQ6_9STRA